MDFREGKNLSIYEESCLKKVLEIAPELVKLIKVNRSSDSITFNSINVGEEEIRTSIRVNKKVWEEFNDLVDQIPYTQKELLSKALEDFIDKYGDLGKSRESKILRELERFSAAFNNQDFNLKTIGEIIGLIRSEKILADKQKKLLLTICLDVLRNEVKISSNGRFYKKGHYFAGNIGISEGALGLIRDKFQENKFTLEDIADIVELVKDNYIDSFTALEFVLRNPEVVLRDDVIEIDKLRFLGKGKYYNNYIHQVIDDIKAQKNKILYDIIYKNYEVPNILIDDIEKYSINKFPTNKVTIYRPKEMEEIHLLLGGGRGNYEKVRKILAQNSIFGDFTDDYLDDVYNFLNKVEYTYEEREKNLAKSLGLVCKRE